MFRRVTLLTLSLSLVALAPVGSARSTPPPDPAALKLATPEAVQPAPQMTMTLMRLILPGTAIAQSTAVAVDTVQTERHSHGAIFWAALLIVVALVGVGAWRLSTRSSDDGASGGGYSSGSMSGPSSGRQRPAQT
jgi:uncharacterized membrane protein YgcG